LHHPLVRALLALTFTTGLLDITSYVGLGHVFTANQTGNLVLLAGGIAGSGDLSSAGPIVSLGAFIVGAGAVGLVTRLIAERQSTLLVRVLTAEIVLLGAAAVLAGVVGVTPGAASGYIEILLLALAMGMRTAVISGLGGADVTLTMLTGTLAGLAASLPFTGGSDNRSVRRTGAASALFLGALSGALMLKTSLWLPIAAAAVVALFICVLYARALRQHE
jgi:uncharacterized membrane protein YoaK (UPF0700 family)